MAKSAPALPSACRVLPCRLARSALLRATALQGAVGLVLSFHAAAQPAASARPTGGQVVAGTASIASAANTTTITQSSNRAAIDWQSYNVGSSQTVTYQQPSAVSVTLNRVTGGDPSAIAGKITANGQLIITNPSGVTFYQGAQVNAQSVVVSAAGITNQNFMAGKMVFDQAANPNARIDNRGTITVKQAGLAALVAPSVANSGTINAKLGQVILAGAAAHTLDMYGDGLVSIDVTKQVVTAPVGPNGRTVTALVTNTGVIQADGGVVQLSAAAADGVVQTLVRAGGRIQANTVGNQTGRIEIAGTGGSVVVEGRVAADGRAPGSTGGQVMVAGSATTTLAAGSHVSANGQAGGGLVAIGTTLARAAGLGTAPAGTSARTIVASGARVSASAKAQGSGGRITVLSTQNTVAAGAFAARGGTTGGDGGTIELSGQAGFALTGTADTSAPHGALGTVLLDPRNLTITSTPDGTANAAPVNGTDPNIGYNTRGTTTDAYVTPAQITGLIGNVHLEATNNLTVASAVTYGGGSLTLDAGNNLTVSAGAPISITNGALTLRAGSNLIPGYTSTATLSLQDSLSASGPIVLNAGSGGIALGASVTAGSSLGVATTGAVTQTAGIITTSNLYGTAASVSLLDGGNQISGIGAGGNGAQLATTVGGVTIGTSSTLAVGSATATGTGIAVPSGQTIYLAANTINLAAPAGATSLSAPNGTVEVLPELNGTGILLTSSAEKPTGVLALSTAELRTVTAGTLQLSDNSLNAGSITLGQSGETIDLLANGGFGTLALYAGGPITQGGPLLTNAIAGHGNTVTLTNAANQIAAIGTFSSSTAFAVTTAGDLAVTGTITAGLSQNLPGSVTLTAGGSISVGGGISALGNVTLAAASASSANPNAAAAVSVGGALSATGDLSITGGTGGIGLAGVVSVTGGTTFNTTGPVVQSAGGLITADLSGTASSVSLPSRSNAIAGVASQYATFGVSGAAGDFTLVDSVGLTLGGYSVGGGLSVQSGRTITLQAPSLTINPSESGPTLSAPGGTIAIAPFTVGGEVLLTSAANKPAGSLVLTTTELSATSAATLQIGTLDAATGTPTAGNVLFGQPGETIDLGTNGSYTNLILLATGNVTQGGPLGVTTISGQAGTLVLTYGTESGSNAISTLNAFKTTAGDLSLHTSTGLTVDGPVTAASVGGAAANIMLSSTDVIAGVTDGSGRAVGMLLNGSLTGATVSLNSSNGTPSTSGGINQVAGVITATSLTGAGGYAALSQPNQIGQLSDFATYQNLTVSTVLPLQVTGTVSSTTAAITLNAAGITQTPSSSLTAVELDGSSSAATVLANNSNVTPGVSNNAIQSIGYFNQSAGDFTLATASPVLGLGGNGGAVTATSGSLNFVADGVALSSSVSGGLNAQQGVVGFAPFTPSRRIELIGDTAADPASLSLSQTFLNHITAAAVVAVGNANSTGAINIGNAGETITIPANASLQLQTTGSVTQGVSPNGQDGGGTLALAASGVAGRVGNLTLTAPANQLFELGYGSSASGSLFDLISTGSIDIADGRAISVANVVSANAATGTLTVKSNGTLTTVVGPFTASAIDLEALTGDLSLGTALTTGGTLNSVTLAAMGGNVVQSAGSITTLSLYVAGQSVSLPAAGNTIGNLIGGAVNTTLSLTNSGPLSIGAQPLTAGTFNLTTTGGPGGAGSVAINGAVTVTDFVTTLSGALTNNGSGFLSATSLSGSAHSVALGGTNQIGTLGPFATTGGFALTNGLGPGGAALTVSGAVTAGGPFSITSNGPLTLSGTLTAPSVALSATAAKFGEGSLGATNGTITQTGGSVTAGSLVLTAGDAFRQTAGALTATGAAGTIAITANGALTLGGTLAAPSVTLTAKTLSVSDYLAPGTQTIPGVISQTGGSITGALTGSSATTATLTASGNAVTALDGFTSSGGFSLTNGQALTVTGAVSDAASIALNVTGALALQAPLTGGAVTLDATGAITQTGAGAIGAGSLTGNAGSVALGAGNGIATLQAFTAAADFALTDLQPLSIAGAVSVGRGKTLTLLDTNPSFASGGSLTATGGTVVIAAATPGATFTASGPGQFMVTAQTLQLGTPTGGPVTIATGLDLTGVTTLDLQSSGAITETSAGSVNVGTLTGQGASLAFNGQNEVATLGAFSTTGPLSLSNAQALTVTGPVTAGTAVDLSVVTGLTLAGNITAPTISLASTDAVTQTEGGTPFAVPSPIGQTGGTITGTTIAIVSGDTLSLTGGAIAGGAGGLVTLSSQGPLTLGEAISGGSVSLVAVTKSAPGPEGTPVVTIGTVSQTGSSLTATTLSGAAAGDAALKAAGNAIGTLAGFTTPAAFALTDGQSLAISGAVSASQVSLGVTGALSEGANGQVTAMTLTGSAQSASLGGANQVGTLGGFTTTTGFDLVNGQALTVAGPVSDGQAIALTTTAGALTLAGNVTAPTVTLTSAAGIGQTGGSITATTLSGSAAGAVALTATGNAVGTLAGFNGVGGFSLVDGQALAVSGTVADATSVALTTTGGLTLNGLVQTGALSLTAAGAVTQPDGSIAARSLTGRAAGATLTAASNGVATLAAFTSTGNFALTDSVKLTVSGAVSVANGGVLALTDNNPTFGTGGSLSAPGGTVALQEFTPGTGITLAGGGGLAGTPPITAQTLTVGTAIGGPITVAGAFNLSGVSVLDLESGGAVTETGTGAIRVATLTGQGASATFGGANQVGTLGGFTTATGFNLVNGQALVVAGPVTDGQSIAVTTTAGALTLAGNVGAPTVTLTSASGIGQTGGSVTATTLSGSAAGAVALTAAGNAIGTLSGFSSAGAFNLVDGQALTVGGLAAGRNAASLTVDGALTLGGSVQAGALDLVATGAITQPGGGVTASSLTGSAAGATLTAASNGVATLAAFTSTGNFALTDSVKLTVSGAVSVANGGVLALTDNNPTFGTGGSLSAPGGTVALQEFTPGTGITLAGGGGLAGTPPITAQTLTVGTATAGPITVAGAFNLSSVSVLNLESGGAVTETGTGAVRVATLTGQGASATFGGANQVGTLGGFTTATGLNLVNGQALTVAGPVADGQSIALTTTAGALTLTGNVTATAVTLTSAAGIGQTGGSITATTLSGSAAGAVALTATGNAVGTLAGFGSVGGFSLVDGQALAVSGTVADATSVALTTTGGLTLTGSVQTGALSLTAAGAITQPGGSITASSLAGSAAGATLTAAGNGVATLASFTSPGNFALTDSVPLTISGTVSVANGGSLTLTDDNPTFGPGGSLSAPGGTVALQGFAPGIGITLAGGGGLTGTPPVTAQTITLGSAAGGPVTIAGALNLSGVSVLDLESGGAITETGNGAIGVAALTGHSASATLGGANQIGTLSDFTAPDGLLLRDTQSLATTGAQTAGAVSLTVTGDLVLSSVITANTSLALLVTGAITQPGGSIDTPSLAGTASSASLGSMGNRVGTLAGFSTTGDFLLADGRSLLVSAPVDPNTVTLSVAGDLTLASSVTGGTVVLNATGAISETGQGQVVATTLTGSAGSASLTGPNQVANLGDFRSNTGLALSDAQGLAVIGAVSDNQSVTLAASGTLTVSGTVSAPRIGLSTSAGGAITQTAGTITTGTTGALMLAAGGPVALGGTTTAGALSIATPGSVVQTGGSLTASALSGSAGGPVVLGTMGPATVGTIGNLTSAAGITLVNAGPLQLAGTLAAPTFTISAPGRLTVTGGTIETDGPTAGQQASSLQVLPGADGTASFVQTGDTRVTPYSRGTSSLRIGLLATGGKLTLDNLQAPATGLVLSLGSGTATGTLNVASLTVLGAGGTADLDGQAAGRSGTDAAQVSFISPQVSAAYTLNGCAIAAVSCTAQSAVLTSTIAASLQASSVIRPDILTLDVLDLSVTRDRDDPTLQLPNISDRDY